MLFLASTPNVAPITDLILTWTHIGQALVGSIGALAFIFALACMPQTLSWVWQDLELCGWESCRPSA